MKKFILFIVFFIGLSVLSEAKGQTLESCLFKPIQPPNSAGSVFEVAHLEKCREKFSSVPTSTPSEPPSNSRDPSASTGSGNTWAIVFKNGAVVTLENVEIFNLQPPVPNPRISFLRIDSRTGRKVNVSLDSNGRLGVQEDEIAGYFRLD